MRNILKYSRPNRRRGQVLHIRRLPQDDRVFRLTPALEQAGYRVPAEILVREGYFYKRIRQSIEERKL